MARPKDLAPGPSTRPKHRAEEPQPQHLGSRRPRHPRHQILPAAGDTTATNRRGGPTIRPYQTPSFSHDRMGTTAGHRGPPTAAGPRTQVKAIRPSGSRGPGFYAQPGAVRPALAQGRGSPPWPRPVLVLRGTSTRAKLGRNPKTKPMVSSDAWLDQEWPALYPGRGATLVTRTRGRRPQQHRNPTNT